MVDVAPQRGAHTQGRSVGGVAELLIRFSWTRRSWSTGRLNAVR